MTTSHPLWSGPGPHITLAKNEVHVWRASLEASERVYSILQRVLSTDEYGVATRFYFERDRRRWTIAHGILRMLLALYLDVDPSKLQFVTNDYGKPAIASPPGGKHLQFNLSHSGDLALYAFAYDRQVGIDVERIRDNIEYEELARSHFSPSEYTMLQTLPLLIRKEAFFLCWSRKEAYIKAKGKGLSIPLDQFDMSLTPGEPATLLASREEPQARERWSVQSLAPGTSYVGALVVEGVGWQLRCWQWQREGSASPG
ncbi:MAG: 4'-phosphopantetheinyl transferase superfamily protein [Chloroflexi bacterium]|nr:MAG: 4'-phosphopantetheinyl transferase superfamily protein [Chloroflexota bacterium]